MPFASGTEGKMPEWWAFSQAGCWLFSWQTDGRPFFSVRNKNGKLA